MLREATQAECYAIDTEFHREGTYFPRLGLVQIAWAEHLVLVDPLAVSIARLGELLQGDGVAVLHAGEQDLEALQSECGCLPKQIFDTQIASGFVGYCSPSLATLHERFLGVELPKHARLSDWLQRPLPADMLHYAAGDVARLLELKDLLTKELDMRGRLGWAEQEFGLLLQRSSRLRNPENAWLKVKEIRRMQGQTRAVAQALARWRQEHAARTNQPVRHVLSDLGVAVLAEKMPKSLKELRELRGVEPRNLRKGADEELLKELARLRYAKLPTQTDMKHPKLPHALKPAVNLIAAWASQYASELELDPALLATRNDIEGLLTGDPNCRAASGWRAEMLAIPVQRLLEGQVAVAFDPQGKLTLEERSGCSIETICQD